MAKTTSSAPTRNAADSQATSNEGVMQPGLLLVGDVCGRTRKQIVGKNGKPNRYIISVNVNIGGEIVTAERWCDSPAPTDVPTMGERTVLPVRMSVFQTASGTRCSLQWGNDSQTESF